MSRDPLELLERYVAREGHALVPKDHIEDAYALGQCDALRRASMSDDAIVGWNVGSVAWPEHRHERDQGASSNVLSGNRREGATP